MTMEMEFYLKMVVVFIISGIIWKIMEFYQKRKEEDAERQYRLTMKILEAKHNNYKRDRS